jgi:hypothetical protein
MWAAPEGGGERDNTTEQSPSRQARTPADRERRTVVSRQEDQAIGRVIAARDEDTEANAQIRSLELATEADGAPEVKRDLRGRLAAAYAHEGRTVEHLQAAKLALLRVIRTDAAKRAGQRRATPDA